jgi:hypothetical protein
LVYEIKEASWWLERHRYGIGMFNYKESNSFILIK